MATNRMFALATAVLYLGLSAAEPVQRTILSREAN